MINFLNKEFIDGCNTIKIRIESFIMAEENKKETEEQKKKQKNYLVLFAIAVLI